MYSLMQRMLPLPIERTRPDALWQYVKRHGIKRIYVDVDKTLLRKEVFKNAPRKNHVGLPEGIHASYRFVSEGIEAHDVGAVNADIVFQNGHNPTCSPSLTQYHVAMINTVLVEQLRFVIKVAAKHYFPNSQFMNYTTHELEQNMPTINILSTGGWQAENFKEYFLREHQLKFKSFMNSEDVMKVIEGPKIGYMGKGRVDLNWDVNNLLIDDQAHQRHSFSLHYNGYSLNPGEWWTQPEPAWVQEQRASLNSSLVT
jgi:hypothetical protein